MFIIMETEEGNFRDASPTSSLKKAMKYAEERAKQKGMVKEEGIAEWVAPYDNSSRVAIWDVKNNWYVEQ